MKDDKLVVEVLDEGMLCKNKVMRSPVIRRHVIKSIKLAIQKTREECEKEETKESHVDYNAGYGEGCKDERNRILEKIENPMNWVNVVHTPKKKVVVTEPMIKVNAVIKAIKEDK